MSELSEARRKELQALKAKCQERLEAGGDFSWEELLGDLPLSIVSSPDSSDGVAKGDSHHNGAKLRVRSQEALEETLDTDVFDEPLLPGGASPSLRPHSSFGDYFLEAEVGRGGMGVVWRARQRSLNRTVALKMLHPHAAPNEQSVRRFQQEARAVAHLSHPNIVTLYEVGEHEGMLFFSMEYIEGQELSGLLKRGSLAPREAARHVLTLAETIAYTHKQGVVHRDLKPSNVLVDANGTLHLMDFGIAKQLDDADGMTKTGSLIGTPGYMAPEQLVSSRKALGPACDIYGLGAVLYKLLTSRAPYEGDSAIEILKQSLESAPIPPRLLHPKISEDLEAICLKCLEREPQDRYGDAGALVEDLRAFLDGSPVKAKHRSAFSHIARLLVRNTEHTTLMARWGRIWQINGLQLLALFLLSQLLVSTGYWKDWIMAALWLGGFGSLIAVIWFMRLRKPARFSALEQQMTKIWFIFALNFLSIAFFNAQMAVPLSGAAGGSVPLPSFFLVPLVLLQVGVAFACMAVVIGGEFFVMAIPCVILAHLSVYVPQWIFLIFGVCLAVGLYLPQWKYGHQPEALKPQPQAEWEDSETQTQ